MKRSVLLMSTAIALAVSAPAWAGEKTRPGFESVRPAARPQPVAPTPPTAPNADEFALIKLTPEIVASANGGAGVLVGVYDGLSDCRHTELAGRCTNTTMPGGTYRYYDNHGTHVAGTVAGKTWGVAPGASVANYAVFDDRRYAAGGTYLIDAWKNAASRGASIASMSFGCRGSALPYCFTAAEIQAMASSGLAGTLFVKAAGNDSLVFINENVAVNATDALTALSRTIFVGSVDVKGTISSFSNRPGETCLMYSGAAGCTDANKWKFHFLVAPGENIYASLPGTGSGYMSGTSMATPIVSGVAALMQAKWPTLKADPAGLANILFTTATDVGAVGVDGVYGWGLLNVTAAFQPVGGATVQSTSGETMDVSGASMTTGSTLSLASVLGGVTAYDKYGRDFQVGEVSSFGMYRHRLQSLAGTGARTAALGRQRDWADAFFAPSKQPQAWMGFGPQGAVLGSGFGLDQSLRAGVSMPVADGGSMSFRLTGSSNTRAELASDAALAPMSFFASSELLDQSAMFSLSRPTGKDSRLVMFAAVSGGTRINPDYQSARDDTQGFSDALEQGFSLQRTPREQAGVGLGFWTTADERTVVGVTASTYVQRHALYDISSDLDTFDKPAQVTSLGAAATREYGAWDLFAAAEATHIAAPDGAGPLRFTDAVLASGEAGVRRSNLLFDGKRRSDSLSMSLALAPRALSGSLQLDYFERTEDGLGRQAVNRDVAMSELTGETVRLQGAYTVRQGQRWSFGLAGGAAVAGEADVAMTSQLRLAF
ncbi:MAG TPA: S8 family peptidase [Caulobacteraceae bacterium]|jgi:hypothetical protein